MTSVTDPSTGTIAKSDRTRYPAPYKQDVLAANDSSSLSAPEFAKQCGINTPTFASWIAARKHGGRPPAREAPAFLLAEVSAASDCPVLKIHLPGEAITRASGASQRRLLAELWHHLA